MASPPADPVLTLAPEALGRLMPMHVSLSPDGIILTAGPTLERIAGEGLVGQHFEAAFVLRRPADSHGSRDIARLAGQPLLLTVAAAPLTQLRGMAVPSANGRLLINLSPGINLAEMVRNHRLSQTDFAATDLAVEMLYLLEVKALVMSELQGLNSRLQGARSIAEQQAQTDVLTGLNNRRAMEERLAALAAGDQPFGIMHLDLDHFKQVNDTFGHAAGDHVLQLVAGVLAAETRSGDLIARVGGDEFIILLPGVADFPPMEAIATRIIRRLDQPIPYHEHSCRVAASLGLALSTAGGSSRPDQLLQAADAALYASKHAGRGRFTRADPALAGPLPPLKAQPQPARPAEPRPQASPPQTTA